MPTLEEQKAQLEELEHAQEAIDADDAKEREARDVAEKIEFHAKGWYNKAKFVVVACPSAPADLPGHYVGGVPSRVAYDRFGETMWVDGHKSGVEEAKSKSMHAMAEQMILYPARDRYKALLEARPAFRDEVGKEVLEAGGSRKKAVGKG